MDKKEKLQKIVRKTSLLNQGGEFAIAKEFLDMETQIDRLDNSVNIIAENVDEALEKINKDLENKFDKENYKEIDKDEIINEVLEKIPTPKDGQDYILTELDKNEIAKSIKVPVIEKIIEKTEVIKEQPIITNEIKEVALPIEGEEIVTKINELPIEPDKQIDFSHIKNAPKFKNGNYYGGSGIKEIIAGENITVDNTNPSAPIINSSGGESFETVSKNLKSYPYTFNKTGDILDSITYTLPTGTITKTFNRAGTVLDTVVLSGSTPSGINLIKTFNRVGGILINITYS